MDLILLKSTVKVIKIIFCIVLEKYDLSNTLFIPFIIKVVDGSSPPARILCNA